MAISLSQFSILSPSQPFSQKLHPPNITISHLKFTHPINNHTPLKLTPKTHQKPTIIPKATQQENENNTTNNEFTQNPQNEQQNVNSDDNENDDDTSVSSSTELGEQIKKAMKEREEQQQKGSTDFWSGVGEEIREIDWPAFNKVLGTTGVVIGVIAGSSVVLLTVNAVLAELSDQVFAGKGVQDFFS